MSDFENLIYLTPIFGLIIICFYKCCCYNSSIKNNNNINNQLQTINYSERIPIINDRFPVILYTIENSNNNNIENNNNENNDILINLENNYNLENKPYETLEKPPSYDSLKNTF
jgi:hypothetical protein